MGNIKVVNTAVSMLKDLMSGDEAVIQRDEYKNISGEEIRAATNLIVNNPQLSINEKAYWLNNIWKINYVHKPPTIDEYLTPEWLGATADQIYPHIRQVMNDFMSPVSDKRILALCSAIGWGKSFLSTLIALYVIIHLSYMRNVKQFFGLNEASSIVMILLSFTKEKVGQVLLQPFSNILRASPYFERTVREDRIEIKQKEIEPGHIAYTSAGRMGAFQFTNDLHIALSSDRANLLGLTIILGIASEISFWIKKGVSIEEIWGTFTDLRGRVNSRFYSRYLSAVILDSSPLDLSISPIDKWLFEGEAQNDPEVMIVNDTHWDVFPERYPIWRKTKETFPVFRGTAAKAPKILDNGHERELYDKEDIIEVPIDKKIAFKNNLKKQLADYAAWPAGGLAKVIDNRIIIDQMFSSQLNNIYSYVYAPSNKPPEHLIWNQIVGEFFIKIEENKYEFYRAPKALRTIHIDLAESGDVGAMAMCHFEVDKKGNNIVVNDFVFGISPEKNTINLDAISEYVMDLRKLGNIRFHLVTADQWQSFSMIQRFKRDNIPTQKLSVDRDLAPYRLVISWMENHRVKVGRNIILKNNFKSLIEITSNKGHTKVDHTKGHIVLDDGGDWKESFMGVHAKDVSDGFVGASYTLIAEVKEISKYQWIDDVIKNEKPVDEKSNIGQKGEIHEDILAAINKRFGLRNIS